MKSSRRRFLKQSLGLLGGVGVGVEALQRLASGASAKPEKYQLSCQTLPYRALPLRRALEGIHRAGYKYVMLFQMHGGKPAFTPDLSADERSELQTILKDQGLTVHMSFVGLNADVKTEKGQSDYKKELDFFREFDVKTLVGIGPWYYERFPDKPKPADVWEKECSLFYKGLEQVVPHAEKLGITITLKPHTGITANAKACLEVLKRIVSNHLKICWDPGNVSFYEGINPDPDFPQMAPHVKAVCIKDHRGGRAFGDFPVPGQGEIDFEATFRTLFGVGFRGPLSLERVDGMLEASGMSADLIDQRIKEAYAFLKPLLDKCVGP